MSISERLRREYADFGQRPRGFCNPEGPEAADTIDALAEALSNARAMLTAFGGDPRVAIRDHGSAHEDEMQAALLDQIDAALARASGIPVAEGE